MQPPPDQYLAFFIFAAFMALLAAGAYALLRFVLRDRTAPSERGVHHGL